MHFLIRLWKNQETGTDLRRKFAMNTEFYEWRYRKEKYE